MRKFAGLAWKPGGAVAIAAAVFMGWLGNSCASQLPGPVEETRGSDIHDDAKLFGAAAIAAARAELRSFESKTGVASMIATVETLDGRSIEKEAQSTAKKSGIEGLFILISKADKKIEVLVSRRYLGESIEAPARGDSNELHQGIFARGL